MIQSFKIPRDRSTMLGLPRVVCALSLCLTAVTVTFVSLSPSAMSGGRSLLMDKETREIRRLRHLTMTGGATPAPIQVDQPSLPQPPSPSTDYSSSESRQSQAKVAEPSPQCEDVNEWGGDDVGFDGETWGEDDNGDDAWGEDQGDGWGNTSDDGLAFNGDGFTQEPSFSDPIGSDDKGYELLSQEMLQHQLQKDVQAIAGPFALSLSAAEHLLRSNHWNSHKANDALIEDAEDAMKDAGTVAQKQDPIPIWDESDNTYECAFCRFTDIAGNCSQMSTAECKNADIDADGNCSSCKAKWVGCRNYTAEDFDALDCGHQICSGCMERNIRGMTTGDDNLIEKRKIFLVKCPLCHVRLSNDMLRKYLSPEKLQQYEHYRMEDYADNNTCLKQCPSRKCTKCPVVKGYEKTGEEHKEACDHAWSQCGVWCKVQPGMITEARCIPIADGGCGNYFCTGCPLESHRPAPCATAENWLGMSGDEARTRQHILETTKECPGCHVRIEKNEGCMHMTCKQAGCGHEFCWLCKGDWKDHGSNTGGFQACNIYVADRAAGNTQTAAYAEEKAKEDAKKYTVLVERYQFHLDAVKCAEVTKAEMHQRISKMDSGFRGGDGQMKYDDLCRLDAYLTPALDTVIECHRLLAWTYPIAFYMPQDFCQKELFERLQKELEDLCDNLHELFVQDGHSVKESDRAGTEVFVLKCKWDFDAVDETGKKTVKFADNKWIKATLVKAPSNADDKKVTVRYEDGTEEEVVLDEMNRVEVGAAVCCKCFGQRTTSVMEDPKQLQKPVYKDGNCECCNGSGKLAYPASEALLCELTRTTIIRLTSKVKTFRDNMLAGVQDIVAIDNKLGNTEVFHLSVEKFQKKQLTEEQEQAAEDARWEEQNPQEAAARREQRQADEAEALRRIEENDFQELTNQHSVAEQAQMMADLQRQG